MLIPFLRGENLRKKFPPYIYIYGHMITSLTMLTARFGLNQLFYEPIHSLIYVLA